MKNRIELSEEQMSRWAELLNLLADLARGIIVDDPGFIERAKQALARIGWSVEIRKGGAS